MRLRKIARMLFQPFIAGFSLGDTVPFVLFTSKSSPFTAFGNVGELDNGPCFNTVFQS